MSTEPRQVATRMGATWERWVCDAPDGMTWAAVIIHVATEQPLVCVQGPGVRRWFQLSDHGFLSTGYINEKFFERRGHPEEVDTVTRLIAAALDRQPIHLHSEDDDVSST